MKLTPHIKNILKNSKKDTLWIKEEKERQALNKESKKSGQVATQLAYYMAVNKISQTELGKRVGVSPQQISKVLKGKENLTLATIEKIEDALDVQLLLVNNLESDTKASPSKYSIEISGAKIPQPHMDFNDSNKIQFGVFTLQIDKSSSSKEPTDYYEQMKAKAIQRAHERFSKNIIKQSFIYHSNEASITSNNISLPHPNEEINWEKLEGELINQS